MNSYVDERDECNVILDRKAGTCVLFFSELTFSHIIHIKTFGSKFPIQDL
jgi:hypothetical protein